MVDDFILRAAFAGMMVALAAGPLGCFVVWRRMAYFGDATAHAAILGVAMALAFSVSVFLGTLLTALAMATIVSALVGRGWAIDTTLGVLAHSALALGLVAVSFQPRARMDLSVYLFGDILTVGATDLWLIGGGAALVLALMIWRWSPLLLSTLSDDLARGAGIDPGRERLVLVLALAVTVAAALKVVGALLIAAMLIVPAATARVYARSPEAMAIIAVGFGALAVVAGLSMSLQLDTPAGPSIVAAAAAFFAGSVAGAALWRVLRAARAGRLAPRTSRD
ncbi:MAG: metal ABC transporter permease [Pararhodobacter sp.]|nr:metal ABC transporter permease [Pararhodobacter sp.]